MRLNIPTLITLFRIIMIPFFVLCFYLPFKCGPFLCSFFFILAALTDCFDGFLARRWKQITRFGTFLDPVVDKVMVVMALILISEYFHSWWITLPSAVIITREIIISALREWLAEVGKCGRIVVFWVSKIKTTIQMLSLSILLWHPEKEIATIGITSLYIATTLTSWSMFKYLYFIRNDLFKKLKDKC